MRAGLQRGERVLATVAEAELQAAARRGTCSMVVARQGKENRQEESRRSGAGTPKVPERQVPRSPARPSARAPRVPGAPWLEVTDATSQADQLEATLSALRMQIGDLEEEVREAEDAADGAELDLATRTALLLLEFSSKKEEMEQCETDVAATAKELGLKRAENLELSRRDSELEKEDGLLQEQVVAARAKLGLSTAALGGVHVQIEEHRASMEATRASVSTQGDRFVLDLARLEKMRARLLQVGATSAAETLAEADAVIEQVALLHQECVRLAEGAAEEGPEDSLHMAAVQSVSELLQRGEEDTLRTTAMPERPFADLEALGEVF